MTDLRLLQAGASELGVVLTDEQLASFSLYIRELLKWNQRANLTAIVDPDQIQTKHFLDSLTCLLAFPVPGSSPGRSGSSAGVSGELTERLNKGAGISCIDVGSGAGFPGVPLKICLPRMRLTLVESVGKRGAFLLHLVRLLKLEETRVLTVRAEDLARDPSEREQYDVAVARALSRLAVVAELCLPFCRVGGRVIAPKKGELAQEIEEGRAAVRAMGGEYGEIVPVRLSMLEDGRALVVMHKASHTPAQYPRRAGIPAKRPLLAAAVAGVSRGGR